MGPHAISRAISSQLRMGDTNTPPNHGSGVQALQLASLIKLEYWHGARN